MTNCSSCHYGFSNHLGNVLAVITDKKIPRDDDGNDVVDYYVADVISATDYSPFGAPLYGRTFEGDLFRFGFNGMEKDNEVKGQGNHYDFGARCYDSRLGRFLSVDPMSKDYVPISPYSFVANSPIRYNDRNGKKIWDPWSGKEVNVTYNSDGQPTFSLEGGGQVSHEFVRTAVPMLSNLSTSQRGRQLVQDMMGLSTKIEFFTAENEDGSPKASGIQVSRNRKGEPRTNKDGLYKWAKINPSKEFIIEKAEETGADYNEVLLGVMMVEYGHLADAEQIQADEDLLRDGFGFKVYGQDEQSLADNIEKRRLLIKEAYEGIMNEAAQAQIDYREEKGQTINETVFMIINGVKRKNPFNFEKVEITEETQDYYEDKK